MSQLVPPHGSPELKPLLLEGAAGEEELKRAQNLRKVPITTRETSDLIMLGIGAFTPLEGFMGYDDWKGCCDDCRMPSRDGLFWPIPITLSAAQDLADSIRQGEEVALWDTETEAIVGTMKVQEKYSINTDHECKSIFRTTDPEHPGVQKVLEQGPVNLAGPVRVLSESYYPELFAEIYQRPAQARQIFAERDWNTVAALQLRNPMHGSHAYLAWVAIEVCDGVYIHQLVGKLKPGDIPADVRVKAIQALVDNYFRPDRVVQGGYPMEMRYAGPREALLHAVFRQNYGCTHLIVAAAALHGLDLLLLRLRQHGFDEDLSARVEGGHRRERTVSRRLAAAALRYAAAQAHERRETGAEGVLQARGDCDLEGVLRRAGAEGGSEAPRCGDRGREAVGTGSTANRARGRSGRRSAIGGRSRELVRNAG
jgi:sulfate adenylyltransferase